MNGAGRMLDEQRFHPAFFLHRSSFRMSSREGDGAVNSAALAEDLIQRAWLPPTVAGLLALSRGGSGAWNVIRCDPGAVLLLLRLPALRTVSADHSRLSAFVQSADVQIGRAH